MQILLTELPELKSYLPTGVVPKWGRFLAPDAAASLLQLERDTGGLVYTDIWRPANVSLVAMSQKTGVQPPGFSGHGYGFSVDMSVDLIMKLKGWTYLRLVEVMESHGWYCHRRDKQMGSECWHFNYFGQGEVAKKYLSKIIPANHATWANGVEFLMQERYGKAFHLEPTEVQAALKSLKMYSGEVDGKFGPLTMHAIETFQRAWGIPVSQTAADRTIRTLAFVTAEKQLVPAGSPVPAAA